MSIYDITGWSGGGRRPISHNLRAGQFRGLGSVNVFGTPTRTVINNNFGGGYNYGYYDDCGSSTPKWVDWCMGGGMVMNFLGQILQSVFPHKNGVDGRGGTNSDNTHSEDFAKLQDFVKDSYTISGPINGKWLAKSKSGEINEFNSFAELQAFVTKPQTKPVVENTVAEKTALEIAQEKVKFLGATAAGISAIEDNGTIKYEYNGKKYDTLEDAIAAKVAKPETNPTEQKAEAGTYKIQSNETWYNIVLKYDTGKSVYSAIGELKALNGLTDRTANIGPNQKADADGNIKIPDGWKLKEEE